ncbi:unnamed protein product [Lampetra fluviatilis]
MWVLVGFTFKFLCLVSCDVWPGAAASKSGHCKEVEKSDGAAFLVCVEVRVAVRRGSVTTLPCTVSSLEHSAHVASCPRPTVTATWTVKGEGGDVRQAYDSRLQVVAGGYVDGDGPAEVSLIIAGVTEGDVATSYYCHPIVNCGEFSVSLGTSHAIRLVWQGCAEPAHEDCQQCAVYMTLRHPLPPPTYDVIAGSSSVTELRGRAPLMPLNGGVASAKALEVARPRDQGLQYVELVMDGNEGGAIRSSGEKVHYSHIRA